MPKKMPKNTDTNWTCKICKKYEKTGFGPDKKSHIEKHCESAKHKKNCQIFKNELEKLSLQDIIDKYNYIEKFNKFINNIEVSYKYKRKTQKGIIKKFYKSNVILDNDKKILNKNIINFEDIKKNIINLIIECLSLYKTVNNIKTEMTKYKPSNEIVWELESNDNDNSKYKEQFSKLQKVIDNVHQFMFANNQINGITAMRDMMKVLPIIILKDYFNSVDFKKEIDKLDNLTDNRKELYKNYSSNIKSFIEDENPLNKWKLYVNNCLSKILPDIFKEGDGIFEFNKSGEGHKTFTYMIHQFNNIKVDNDFKDAFACSCGDIHELFRKYTGGEAKAFGGFNTPRHTLNMIYNFNQIKKLIIERLSEETSIFDPTMGTAGFLTRFFNLYTMNAEYIYGCELSPDTIKFAFVSLYLTSGKIIKNLESCNSLSESENIFKKHIIGLANPPFGTSIKYKKYTKGKGKSKQTFDGEIETFIKFHLKDKYDTEEDKKEDEEKYKKLFKEIYPIETNNGACLFTQHFVYKLEENGLGIIILPDGEIFDGNSQWSKTFRKWLLNNVNLKMIIKMPQGTFEHVTVKTNVLVFTKNGKTKNIQYFDTTKECNVVKELFTITEEDLKSTNYSLNMSVYLKEEKTYFKVPEVELDDICEFKNGSSLKKCNYVIGDYPVINSGTSPTGYHNKYNRNENTILCASSGTAGYISMNDKKVWAGDCFSIIPKDLNICNNEYLYRYLKSIQNKIYKLQSGGGRQHVYSRDLKKLKIALPSIEKQKIIINELKEKCDKKKIETKQKIEDLKNELINLDSKIPLSIIHSYC
tara:strand:- start:7517 stop:9949 length:2433 start_codon:yes stop_codon:yes gene_type:complete